MRKVAIGIAAAITLAAGAPANAQGLWVGAPDFGVGIGVGPTYAYQPYYGGYWGSPYSGRWLWLRAELCVPELRI